MRTKMLGLAAIASLVVPMTTVAALPTVASAQPVANYMSNPCGPAQKNARITGGAIGAVGGAALGRSVAARNARTEGTILGALVGAAVGQEVGRRTGCRSANAGYAPAYSQGYQTSARPPCKAVAGNRYVCLQPDGRWR